LDLLFVGIELLADIILAFVKHRLDFLEVDLGLQVGNQILFDR